MNHRRTRKTPKGLWQIQGFFDGGKFIFPVRKPSFGPVNFNFLPHFLIQDFGGGQKYYGARKL